MTYLQIFQLNINVTMTLFKNLLLSAGLLLATVRKEVLLSRVYPLLVWIIMGTKENIFPASAQVEVS